LYSQKLLNTVAQNNQRMMLDQDADILPPWHSTHFWSFEGGFQNQQS